MRLWSQHITQADFTSAHDVVAWMGAMQAQDYAGALWSIALRTPELTRQDIEVAIEKAEIVRTWPMRGTLHFVAPEDIRWMVGLMGPRASQKAKTRRLGLAVDDTVIRTAMDALEKALGGRKYLSRPDIMNVFEAAGIATAGQRGIHILGYLAEQGFICFGPHVGKQPSFALLEEWVAKASEISRDEALARLASRYFISHGPALETDFAAWTGLTMSDVRRGIELAGDSLTRLKTDQGTYWMDARLKNTPQSTATSFLLPGFDEYMLGYRDRSAALPKEYSNHIVPGGNGMFLSTIVIDGQVKGTWKKTVKKASTSVVAQSFTPLTIPEQASLVASMKRYETFTGQPTEITFS